MYCRNCGNEVSDKAIACPKCGVNPRTEKSFCPSCGSPTASNQVMCTKCNAALSTPAFSFDASALQKIDINAALKNKSILFAALALLGCFLPWFKLNAFVASQSFSCFGLSKMLDMTPDSILVPFLLYLIPLSLAAIIASQFIPQLAKYKRALLVGALILVIYAGIGLYKTANPSVPKAGNDAFGFGEAMAKEARSMMSVGFGFYVTLIGTIASFYFGRKE
ncbi:zinc ribbon domain-containing protein [Danxiaibacter flavus]|uniref:Zinc ribbon domain-containing protein n=1 Tax=Danxiaibacter flavus TaxID=3049108 RepID=A0ABV3ZE75_9BACT|nr:zinc ribbon domain-containing protein [Chitinophagaceae bacterium DXS]